MIIQSLSIVVPNPRCINHCPFCVSRMKNDRYINQKEKNLRFFDLYETQFKARLDFARDNGCNVAMLTGNSEPQQNVGFLKMFGTVNRTLQRPFRWVELQTTGVLLDDEMLRFLRNHVGVSTISLSVSSFNSRENAQIIGMPNGHEVNLEALCEDIKRYDFTLRLSINMLYPLYGAKASDVFHAAHALKADQVTLRQMYTDGNNSDQAKWVNQNALNEEACRAIFEYVRKNGRVLQILEYGRKKYSLLDMSVVIDDDCMSTEERPELKYVILRENCKLYSKWDDEASLLF